MRVGAPEPDRSVASAGDQGVQWGNPVGCPNTGALVAFQLVQQFAGGQVPKAKVRVLAETDEIGQTLVAPAAEYETVPNAGFVTEELVLRFDPCRGEQVS